MENNLIYKFLKFGQKEHMFSLLEKGLLYFNTVDYFKEEEKNAERKDPYKCAEKILQLNTFEIDLGNGKKIKMNKANKKAFLNHANLKIFNEDKFDGNIYCMTAITTDLLKKTKALDNKIFEFGDYVVVINNPKIFLERVKKNLIKKDLAYMRGPVKYYDEKEFSGHLGPLSKSNQYSHQNEYRIFIKNNYKKPLTLSIGSIQDIAEIHHIYDIDAIRFELQNH